MLATVAVTAAALLWTAGPARAQQPGTAPGGGVEGLPAGDGVTELLPEQVAFEDADRMFRAGDMQAAAALYRQALAAFPDTPYMEQALYQLGMALYKGNRHQDAKVYWKKLLKGWPQSQYAPEVSKRLLSIYKKQKEYEGVLDILLGWLSRAQPEDKPKLLADIADTHLAMGEPERAIKQLLKRKRYLPEARHQEAEDRVRKVIDNLSVSDLEALADTYRDPVPGAWILERLVRHYAALDDQYPAEKWANELETRFSYWDGTDAVRKLMREAREKRAAHRYRIGLMLHLSGKMGRFGERVRKGAQLAYLEARKKLPEGEVALWVRDQALPEPLLGTHFGRLLREAEPTVVVGPLMSSEAAKMARSARSARVPLIAPVVPVSSEMNGPVIGLGLSPEMEGLAAARLAVRENGLSKLVVLAPQGAYGDRVAAAFTAEAERLGAEVFATVRFTPKATGIRASIRQLVQEDLKGDGTPEVTEEEVERLGEYEMEIAGLLEEEEEAPPPAEEGVSEESASADGGEAAPAVPVPTPKPKPKPKPLFGPPVGPHPYFPSFDGVFLAGPWRQVVLVAPHLPFHDINVPLFGTSGWYDGRLIGKAGGSVSGAQFVTAFGRQGGLEEAFVKSFKATYGEPPDVFAALGYDAMTLALKAVVGDEPTAWDNLVGPFAGVTGRMRVMPEGGVERDLRVMTVKGRRFVQMKDISSVPEPDPEGEVADGPPVTDPLEAGHAPRPRPATSDSKGKFGW